MIRVCLVDDQTLVRLGLRRLLELAPDIEVVAEAGDGQEAVAVVCAIRPDVLLLDVRMPRLDGLGVLEALNIKGSLPPTLMLTTFNDDEALLRSRKAGARGFLLKDASLETLLDSIRTVARGETFSRPVLSEHVVAHLRQSQDADPEPEASPELSPRELELLRLMAGGYSNRELADLVQLKEGTVKNLVSSILFKLQARDRTRAVLRALELGIL
ncbi:response regulator transcription factor [Deinococcus sp. Leaf326]|jgi:DNA-binding NarL/FixJ family response regulator|uniref:response regulator n=1 Tax=Deinococcus sp. Leaf326 TaxID=1736338 RepID=UPI0006FF0BDE|nr:response regulator transcription factor [Deinococcus sp. Leaf326]KQR26971.1 LuxR family transcriptional regulator [Deinococcus sp. Leaf326]